MAEHRGRVVKTTGDGMLVEIAGLAEALRDGGSGGDDGADRRRDLDAGRRRRKTHHPIVSRSFR
jgi:class 3 adenylate cyclase